MSVCLDKSSGRDVRPDCRATRDLDWACSASVLVGDLALGTQTPGRAPKGKGSRMFYLRTGDTKSVARPVERMEVFV